MTDRLDAIAIFVAVADLGSFAEAARRLNRTPAAITRAVAALETQLRLRLLNRTTRSVALTDDGARYLDGCRRLLASYDDLRMLEEGREVPPHGAIRITAPSMFGRLHVLPSIGRFLQRYTLVDIRAQLVDRVVSLVDEGLDLGVRLGRLPDSALRATRVGQVTLGVYGNPDYLARHGTPDCIAALGDHKTISCLAIGAVPDRWSFDAAEAPGGGSAGSVAVKPRLIVDLPDAAAAAAASGVGLTFIVCYQAAPFVAAESLIQVLQRYRLPPIPIHIVQPAGRFVPAKVRLLADQLAHDLRTRFGNVA